MVDIKELAVGNWVRFPHGIDKIDELCMWANSAATATNRPVSVENLEPIAITPEILEKNGWVAHGSNTFRHFLYADGYDPIIDLMNINDHWKLDIDGLFIWEIHFVHQLQNALTLCGIDKEIELP